MVDKFSGDKLREQSIMPDHDRDKFYVLPKGVVQLYGLLPGFDATTALVYAVLRDHANERGEAWPSTYTLAIETRTSTATVKRHIKTLKECGLIETFSRADGHGNVYIVHEPLGYDAFMRQYPSAVEAYEKLIAQVDAIRHDDKGRKKKKENKARVSDGEPQVSDEAARNDDGDDFDMLQYI